VTLSKNQKAAQKLLFLCSKNGRVGAINLEQLDLLLNSLKTYWDYSNQRSFLTKIKASQAVLKEGNNVLAFEL
jgi:hypothetical protein